MLITTAGSSGSVLSRRKCGTNLRVILGKLRMLVYLCTSSLWSRPRVDLSRCEVLGISSLHDAEARHSAVSTEAESMSW